jgi:hypothetical protein
MKAASPIAIAAAYIRTTTSRVAKMSSPRWIALRALGARPSARSSSA